MVSAMKFSVILWGFARLLNYTPGGIRSSASG